jgi:hypothetical protein
VHALLRQIGLIAAVSVAAAGEDAAPVHVVFAAALVTGFGYLVAVW